jgi:hypothetical protein
MLQKQQMCSFEGCINNARTNGLCNAHYTQWQRTGILKPAKKLRICKYHTKITGQDRETKEHAAYRKMKGRSYNCHGLYELWKIAAGFDDFMDHIGYAPSVEHSLDRIDGTKGYFPGNVRWATRQEQNRNKSKNAYLTFQGRTQTMRTWAEELGFAYYVVYLRVTQCGWSAEKALTTPVRKYERLV